MSDTNALASEASRCYWAAGDATRRRVDGRNIASEAVADFYAATFGTPKMKEKLPALAEKARRLMAEYESAVTDSWAAVEADRDAVLAYWNAVLEEEPNA